MNQYTIKKVFNKFNLNVNFNLKEDYIVEYSIPSKKNSKYLDDVAPNKNSTWNAK